MNFARERSERRGSKAENRGLQFHAIDESSRLRSLNDNAL
jgi:hypothetical protein